MTNRGEFVVIEGLPGSGKTTQAKYVEAKLNAERYEPIDGITDEIANNIMIDLAKGRTVVCERYTITEMAKGKKIFHSDYPTPDIVIYLRAKPSVCYNRLRERNHPPSLKNLEETSLKYEKSLMGYPFLTEIIASDDSVNAVCYRVKHTLSVNGFI